MPTASGSYCVSQTRQRMKSTLTTDPGKTLPYEVSRISFRRVETLPPYVFAQINELKRELRHAGRDVVDLGFGNPDIPSPAIAVEKLREAALRPVNHRYSVSRGLPQLRAALAELYERRFGVTARPRHAGGRDDRRQGGAVASDVGAGRARRLGNRSLAELSDPPVRARLRRCDDRRGAAHPVVRRRRPRGVRAHAAAPAGRRSCRSRTTRPRRRRPARTCSGSSTSRSSETCCSSTTSPTRTSPSTATARPRCSRSPARSTAASSCTA